MKIQVCGLEEWRPIPDFEGYEVSNFGRVRSYRPLNGKGGLLNQPHLLKALNTPKKKYLRVGISNEFGKLRHFPIHTLVLTAFVGPRPSEDHDSYHNNGDARHNHLSNLRWDTKQANADDRIRHGTQIRGEAVGIAVLTETQVREIKAAIPTWKKGLGKYFAQKFGVGNTAISYIKHNKTWCHV